MITVPWNMNATPPTSSSLLRGLGLLPKKQAAFLSTFSSHLFLLLVLEAAVPWQIPAGCHQLFSCIGRYETPMALAEGSGGLKVQTPGHRGAAS